MSRSFRDQDRRISKALNKDMNRSFSDGSPDIAEKIDKCRNSKNIFRYGNNRKAISIIAKLFLCRRNSTEDQSAVKTIFLFQKLNKFYLAK